MSEAQPAQPQQQVPPLVVNAQYVKDLSFEVPNAPEVFSTLRGQPAVNINLDVQARRLQDGQDVFEVTLQIRAEAVEPPNPNGGTTNGAGTESKPVFIAELAFCGVFTLTGVPAETVRAGAARRMPALAVSLRPQHPGRRHPRRRLPAGAAAADRFRGALAEPPGTAERKPPDSGPSLSVMDRMILVRAHPVDEPNADRR